jgi:trehalose utilization protein
MPANTEPLHVTIWNEGRHEKTSTRVQQVYPEGIHGALAQAVRAGGHAVCTATLDEPEHGLPERVLEATDVLLWWGHTAHEAVSDTVVERVYRRVLEGMGLVVLHSAHFSRIFRRLMATSCDLTWREAGESERIWVVQPAHPIARGLEPCFEIPHEETYGEYFDIPTPDELVLVSWFQGGEVFRSGCCYYRGRGKVFYFRPGHETYPTFHQPEVQTVIRNAILWAAPSNGPRRAFGHRPVPLENTAPQGTR